VPDWAQPVAPLALLATVSGAVIITFFRSYGADLGQHVPAPVVNVNDFTPASASGKVLARLPRSMHMQLTARAKTEGVSLNSLVLTFIAEGLGRRSATL
jgi:HicB family